MTRRLLLAALLLAVGCGEPQDNTHEGIAVGNPGVVSMSLAEADTFTFTEASLPVDWVGFADCEGGARFVYPADADLAVTPLSLQAPAGEWCGIQVAFQGTATLAADWDDGVGTGSLSATLELADVGLQVVDARQTIDEDTELALELASPDWLDPGALGLADGVDLVIDIDDPEHGVIVAAIVDESAVFADEDGSGRVETAERDAGALALPATLGLNPDVGGATADAAGMSSGCSCASGGSAPSLGWAVLLLLAVVRRRAR